MIIDKLTKMARNLRMTSATGYNGYTEAEHSASTAFAAALSSTARLAYQPYKWLVFIPLCFGSIFVFGTGAILFCLVGKPGAASRICGVWWARFNCFITPSLVSVEGRHNVEPGRSYVVVANHRSTYDIFLLYGWLGIDFRWVMKKELRKAPVLGSACERIGHIYIDRSDSAAAVRSIQEAKDKINGGTSVLFFPEGTRNKGEGLLPFKKGAFRMAADLGLPVLPVTIVNSGTILPADSWDLFPGKARIIIHQPIETVGMEGNSSDYVREVARRRIESALEN